MAGYFLHHVLSLKKRGKPQILNKKTRKVAERSLTFLEMEVHTRHPPIYCTNGRGYPKKRILPSVAYLDGDYLYRDLFLGVSAIFGGNAVEKIIEFDLTAEEKAALDLSAQSLVKTLAVST